MNMNLKGIMQTLGAKPGQVLSDPYARAFAPQPTIKEEEGSEDHEVSMAQNQLDSIIKHATELKQKMGTEEKQIPAWIQDHITNSENYISQAASNYHEYGDTNEAGINGAPRYPSMDGVANESVNEGRYDSDLDKIETAVKNASSFMGVGAELKKAGIKYTFATEMIPMYMIKVSGNTIAIVNKKYAAGAERTVKDIAIGLLERKINEEFKHIISVETPTQVVSKPIAKQIEDLAKKGVRSKDIGLKMGFVGNQKLATDAFQKLKNQIYFKLNKSESVNEAVDIKDGKYRFYSKDGVGYLTYGDKEIASGDFDWEDGSNSYWMSHSSFKGSQKAFDTGKDVINYFKSKKITTESVNEARLTDIVNSIVETPVIGKMVSRTPSTTQVTEAKKYDIGSGWMGNGLTIWNRAEEEHGDYKIIAHISPDGKLSIRDKQLPSDIKKMFQTWADTMKKGDRPGTY